ncbi:hypothetical protein BB559_000556 [Furculomyces boomerangus]|uniref:Uncharacterized protein n=2 Tax=Harpellales TaxID=61421 RepID=A0A2T9Z4R2_9FUNG|nr:hypothetical protein BB559_000556 [Furculomyces boomerangus]PWA00963.1 hypothetical protein BB558_002974 [Smittium angustum]
MNSTVITENDTTSLKTLDTTETLQDTKNSKQYAKVADTHDISLRSIRTSK